MTDGVFSYIMRKKLPKNEACGDIKILKKTKHFFFVEIERFLVSMMMICKLSASITVYNGPTYENASLKKP